MAKLSTWCFEHSGDISRSLLVNPSHTDESWEGRNTCMWIYKIYTYIQEVRELVLVSKFKSVIFGRMVDPDSSFQFN